MSVRTLQRNDGAVFFCTFTCYKWLPLIEITSVHDRLYNWMRIAHGKGFQVLGFVIMPNHAHLLIHAPEGGSINGLMGNGKRFLAYDVVARLKSQGEQELLATLRNAVRPSDAERGQSHRVFATSSDIRECFDRRMIEQKLDYMHNNPVEGVWSLVDNALDYPHSSAAFYERGDLCLAPITHYQDIIG
jgi:REP element-mobilizing transposase RayT